MRIKVSLSKLLLYFHIIYLSILFVLSSDNDYNWECPTNTSLCLSGDKHKTISTSEDPSKYAQCKNYVDNSCCTSNFTQQLATSDVTHITDGNTIFNWTHCGSISELCESYLISIECFYRCSPLLIYFAGEYESSLNNVPLCSSFCNNWYNACKNDYTCVKNWIFDWEYDNKTGENICPENSQCKTFEEMYQNSTELCNVLWGDSFDYIDDTDDNSLCLVPNNYTNNIDVVDDIFDDICDATGRIYGLNLNFWIFINIFGFLSVIFCN